MEVNVDKFDVNHLYHTASRSFWHEQEYRFELVKSDQGFDEDDPPDYGVMVWVGDNYLSALIVYNWYVSTVVGDDAAILWDMAENPEPEYCVWIGVKGEWPENYDQVKGEDEPSLVR